MDGVTWFWTVVGALVVCWVLKCAYMRYYGATGRHHTYWFYDEIYPRGAVWFQRGEWYTQPRFAWPSPRRFSERSNPLDVPTTFELIDIPQMTRRVEREVEY